MIMLFTPKLADAARKGRYVRGGATRLAMSRAATESTAATKNGAPGSVKGVVVHRAITASRSGAVGRIDIPALHHR